MDGAAARSQQSAHDANAVDAHSVDANSADAVDLAPRRAARQADAAEQQLTISPETGGPQGDAAGAGEQSGAGEGRHLRSIEAAPAAREEPTLGRRELDILAFERQWWKYAGAKEDAIKSALGLSATRYYQILNAIIDRPEALQADPMHVKRLRRLRAGRQKARAARRLGFTIT